MLEHFKESIFLAITKYEQEFTIDKPMPKFRAETIIEIKHNLNSSRFNDINSAVEFLSNEMSNLYTGCWIYKTGNSRLKKYILESMQCYKNYLQQASLKNLTELREISEDIKLITTKTYEKQVTIEKNFRAESELLEENKDLHRYNQELVEENAKLRFEIKLLKQMLLQKSEQLEERIIFKNNAEDEKPKRFGFFSFSRETKITSSQSLPRSLIVPREGFDSAKHSIEKKRDEFKN